MNIIVSGCGKIGKAIIATLVAEGHDLTIIDKDNDVISEVTNIYDVIGVNGNCADCETLQDAAIESCDLFVALTNSDELNMVTCFIAKKMGAKHTVARIRNPEYNESSVGFLKEQFNLSMAINPEYLVAEELYNILKFPSAFKVEYFSRRNLEMIELKIKENSPLCGVKLSKLREKEKYDFLIGAVMRKGEVIVPDGSFELKAGDIVTIVAPPHYMQKLLKSLGILSKQARDVMILGGGKIAYYLSKMLLSSNSNSVTLIEKDKERCEEFSEELPEADVINGDGSSQELLIEEGLHSADAFVTLTGTDEINILMAIFACGQRVPKVIAKVNREGMDKMAENLGLDCIVSTKSIASDVVLRYVRALENSVGSNIETLYKLMDSKAEALEFNIKNNSKIVDVPIKQLNIKSGILIAAVIRQNKKVIIPSGDDVINVGDRVVVIASEHKLTDISQILD